MALLESFPPIQRREWSLAVSLLGRPGGGGKGVVNSTFGCLGGKMDSIDVTGELEELKVDEEEHASSNSSKKEVN